MLQNIDSSRSKAQRFRGTTASHPTIDATSGDFSRQFLLHTPTYDPFARHVLEPSFASNGAEQIEPPFIPRGMDRHVTRGTELPVIGCSSFQQPSSVLSINSTSAFRNTSLYEPLGRDGEALGPLADGHELYPHYLKATVGREDNPETHSRRGSDPGKGNTLYPARRKTFTGQDEFDGPSQLLSLPTPQEEVNRSQQLPRLPTHLTVQEQDDILQRAHSILSHCAFYFVAKYQFPVPIERDKPHVKAAGDRDWAEWAYLLKRLATKRRIPARVLYDNQIKHLVTTLENSIAVRHQNQKSDYLLPPSNVRDDRYILQMISSGIQVAKLLMDSLAMELLDELYRRTEAVVLDRRDSSRNQTAIY